MVSSLKILIYEYDAMRDAETQEAMDTGGGQPNRWDRAGRAVFGSDVRPMVADMPPELAFTVRILRFTLITNGRTAPAGLCHAAKRTRP
jgi:hypothetical protein